MSRLDEEFVLFGSRSAFALEMRLLDEPNDLSIPLDSVGSWGAWRLWIAGANLCDLRLHTRHGWDDVTEARWFLAPLFRWLVGNWMPLLHEAHLPTGGNWGDRRPRWARLAYLAMLENAGDDVDRFGPWQDWASRHSLRSAAEGGIVPDVFFQRIGDEIELSWGDRLQPGAESATFRVEEGVSRAPVGEVAGVLRSAIRWFLEHDSHQLPAWRQVLVADWADIDNRPATMTALAWYLDSAATPGPRTALLFRGLESSGRTVPLPKGPVWTSVAPEVAMFGDVAPSMSDDAARTLLLEYWRATAQDRESPELARLVATEPAWTVTSPWNNGYALALDVLEQAENSIEAPATDIEDMLTRLNVSVRDVDLGEEGPRGVALAGQELQPTILVNEGSPINQGSGRRFTLAHELCHILFDRERARPLTHTSTPWAPASIEQRANAFAAMLLMPPRRARRPNVADPGELQAAIRRLAARLGVGRVALLRHLANTGEISPFEQDMLLAQQT